MLGVDPAARAREIESGKDTKETEIADLQFCIISLCPGISHRKYY
jgi:hypothetical protein